MWVVQPMQIADPNGGMPTGRWRMTARNMGGGNVPVGDESHDHESAEAAKACPLCDEFVCNLSGLPTKAQREAHGKQSVKETLLRFGRMVEKQARETMLNTGRIEGAHYAAMRAIFPTFGIDYDEDIARIVTEEETEGEEQPPLLILPQGMTRQIRKEENQ